MADPGFLKGGFSLTKTPAQFELKTKKKKKKVIGLHTSLSAVFYIYYWMISNKTAVIGASQSDCSIRESRSDCSIRVYMNFKRGFPWKPWNPPGSATEIHNKYGTDTIWILQERFARCHKHIINIGTLVNSSQSINVTTHILCVGEPFINWKSSLVKYWGVE